MPRGLALTVVTVFDGARTPATVLSMDLHSVAVACLKRLASGTLVALKLAEAPRLELLGRVVECTGPAEQESARVLIELYYLDRATRGALAQFLRSEGVPAAHTEAAQLRHVLIADDDRASRRIIEVALRSVPDLALHEAATVADANDQICSQPIDLAFVDLLLPDGSGHDILARLREVHPDAIAIVMTGFANVDDAVQALRGEAFDFVRKPFQDMAAVRQCARRALDGLVLKRERTELVQRLAASVDALKERNQALLSARASLERQEKLATVGRLTSGLFHEVINPLTGVSCNIEYLRAELIDQLAAYGLPTTVTDDLTSCLDDMTRGVSRILHILRSLKLFARQGEQVEHRSVDLAQVVASALELLEPKIRERARLATDLGQVEVVNGDPVKLSEVVVHLIDNALDAFRDRPPAQNRLYVSCRQQGALAQLVIRDNGPGIPAHQLERIFDPFYSTKDQGQGIGLGLSLCHGVVEAHGGRIEVFSRPGEGAAFSVYLPTSDHQAEPELAIEEGEIRWPNVLLVDDDRNVLAAGQRILGAEVHLHVAADSGKALELLDKLGDRLDCILCPLTASGIDGRRLYESAGPLGARFVFTTGVTLEDDLAGWTQATGRPVLKKPLEAQALRQAVGALTSRLP